MCLSHDLSPEVHAQAVADWQAHCQTQASNVCFSCLGSMEQGVLSPNGNILYFASNVGREWHAVGVFKKKQSYPDLHE